MVASAVRGGLAVDGTRDIEPIRSEFADDPEMAELIAAFVDGLAVRLAELKRLWREKRLDEVRQIAHQLKGAAGGYGYPTLGHAAAKLEALLADARDRLRVYAALQELEETCRRVIVAG